MALIELKCSSCGGSIKMDESKENGFCMYCGNKFLVRDELTRIAIEHSGSVEVNRRKELENMLALAEKKIDERNNRVYETIADFENYMESIRKDYIDQALIIDPDNPKAKELSKRMDVCISVSREANANIIAKSYGCIVVCIAIVVIAIIIIMNILNS